MSYSFTKKTYSTQSNKTSSPSQAIEDAKKKSSLLKDNSWIRKDAEEDEPVERDPNFGRAVLSRYKPNEALDSSKSVDAKSPQTTSGSTSYVQSLTKRFSASQDELNKGKLVTTTVTTNTKNGKTTEQTTTTTTTTTQNVVKTPTKTDTFTQKVFSDIKSPSKSVSSLVSTEEPMTTTFTKVTVKEDPKTSTIVTTSTKNGNPTEQTTTTTQNVVKTPTKTDIFTDKVFSDIMSPSKSIANIPLAPAKPKVEDDQLYDTLIPTSIKSMLTPDGETTVSKTETVTVKSGNGCSNGESTKTTTTTKTSVTTEDKLFDSLLPTSFQSFYNTPDSTTTTTTTVTKKDIVVDSTKDVESKPVSSPTSSTKTSSRYSLYSSVDDHPYTQTTSYTNSSKPRDEYTKTNSIKSYSSQPDGSYEYTSVTSPSAYTPTSYKDNSSRAVLEKDLCSYCKKAMSSDPKMVLEDMSINCHATCFKCEVCSSNLGNLKAGDSMWIYRRTVHCEKCFGITREKWRR